MGLSNSEEVILARPYRDIDSEGTVCSYHFLCCDLACVTKERSKDCTLKSLCLRKYCFQLHYTCLTNALAGIQAENSRCIKTMQEVGWSVSRWLFQVQVIQNSSWSNRSMRLKTYNPGKLSWQQIFYLYSGRSWRQQLIHCHVQNRYTRNLYSLLHSHCDTYLDITQRSCTWEYKCRNQFQRALNRLYPATEYKVRVMTSGALVEPLIFQRTCIERLGVLTTCWGCTEWSCF